MQVRRTIGGDRSPRRRSARRRRQPTRATTSSAPDDDSVDAERKQSVGQIDVVDVNWSHQSGHQVSRSRSDAATAASGPLVMLRSDESLT